MDICTADIHTINTNQNEYRKMKRFNYGWHIAIHIKRVSELENQQITKKNLEIFITKCYDN